MGKRTGDPEAVERYKQAKEDLDRAARSQDEDRFEAANKRVAELENTVPFWRR